MSEDYKPFLEMVLKSTFGFIGSTKHVTKNELMEYKRHLDRFLIITVNNASSLGSSIVVVLSPPTLPARVFILDEKVTPTDFDETHDEVGNSYIDFDQPTINALTEVMSFIPNIGPIEVRLYTMEKKTVTGDPSSLISRLEANKDKIKSITGARDLFIIYYNDGTYDKLRVVGDPAPLVEYLNANFNLVRNSTCGGGVWTRQ